MRRNLEVGRVLHEAEAAVKRHERVAVEVAQGSAGGNAARLVHIGDGRVPVASGAAERNLPRATGVPEHAKLLAARGAALIGMDAGMLPKCSKTPMSSPSRGRRQTPVPNILPRRGDTHLDSSIRPQRTCARQRDGRGTAAKRGGKEETMPRRRIAPPSDIEPLFHFCHHCDGNYTPQEGSIEGVYPECASASTRAATVPAAGA